MNAHQFITSKECVATHANSHASCVVCDGGLCICKVCNGAEGSLPSECPGQKMTQAEEDAVMRGDVDFIDGRWIVAEIVGDGHGYDANTGITHA